MPLIVLYLASWEIENWKIALKLEHVKFSCYKCLKKGMNLIILPPAMGK